MKITFWLIIINAVLFACQVIFTEFTLLFSLTPTLALSGYYWQFFTYMFLHGSVNHFFINMFILFIFGLAVEKTIGKERFIFLYLISGVGSSIFYIFLTGVSDTIMLGASGAVFGILTAYAFLFPKNWVLIFPGIPMPAAFLVVFFMIFETFLGVTGLEPGIANFGHVGGIITSALIMFYWRYRDKRSEGRVTDFDFTFDY